MAKPTDVDKDKTATSRRRFLREGGVLVGGAVVAGSLAGSKALAENESRDNLPPNVPEWMKTPGDPMGGAALRDAFAVREGCHKKHPS